MFYLVTVIQDLLEKEAPDALPDVGVLVQPTSPFLLPNHISGLLDVLSARPSARTAHTVVPVSHNQHSWNQRKIVDGMAEFVFHDERSQARNKQEKPNLYVFGNLIVARVDAILDGSGFYASPCATMEINRPYEFDLDTAVEIDLAEALIQSGCVDLPHMAGQLSSLSLVQDRK